LKENLKQLQKEETDYHTIYKHTHFFIKIYTILLRTALQHLPTRTRELSAWAAHGVTENRCSQSNKGGRGSPVGTHKRDRVDLACQALK
jgi:hypothetical protein